MHPVIFSTITNRSASERFNVLWGQEHAPIQEALQLMKKEKWTFPAEPKRSEGGQPQAARRASAARQIELE
jgi:hypothetical protein